MTRASGSGTQRSASTIAIPAVVLLAMFAMACESGQRGSEAPGTPGDSLMQNDQGPERIPVSDTHASLAAQPSPMQATKLTTSDTQKSDNILSQTRYLALEPDSPFPAEYGIIFVGAGTMSDRQPGVPEGTIQGDIMVAVCMDVTGVPSGWTALKPGFVYWRRAASSSEPAPEFTPTVGPGASNLCQIASYRGAAAFGDPFESVGDASGSYEYGAAPGIHNFWPAFGINTLTDGALVLMAAGAWGEPWWDYATLNLLRQPTATALSETAFGGNTTSSPVAGVALHHGQKATAGAVPAQDVGSIYLPPDGSNWSEPAGEYMERAALFALKPSVRVINGVVVRITSAEPWLHREDTVSRLSAVLRSSAEYWGINIAALEGYTLWIKPQGELTACGPGAGGCYYDGSAPWDGYSATIELMDDAGPFAWCVEGLAIPHEIGHGALHQLTGSPNGGHTDPLWPGLSALQQGWRATKPDCW